MTDSPFGCGACSARWRSAPRCGGRNVRSSIDIRTQARNHDPTTRRIARLIVLVLTRTPEVCSQDGSSFLPATWNADASPLRGVGTQSGSLSAIVQNFKSVSSRRIHVLRAALGTPFWQRNYYEHVVRDDADLARIRAYIQDNPAKWALDPLHPAGSPNRRPSAE